MRFWLSILLPLAIGALSLASGARPLRAQTVELRVVVHAHADGEPLAHARVAAANADARVAAANASALTDSLGVAALRLAPGAYRLQVRHPGHVTAERRLQLRADTLVLVELEAAHEAEAIIVSTARTERRLEDEPLRIEVISGEEVEEKVLMTPGDIAMLLNETSGLRVQPASAALGGAGIRIQGLRGRYTQVLADGLPLYGGQSAALGPLQIPPMDLQQVEVIKGAASALYGSTALGGVVNLISRRPAGARELLVNQTSRGGRDVVLWWEGADRPLSYTLLTGVHAQSMQDVDDDSWADQPAYRRIVARPRVHWHDERGSSLLFTAGTLWEAREGGTLQGRTLGNGVAYREKLETRRADLGLSGRHVLAENRHLTVRGSVARQRHEHDFAGLRERDAHSTAVLETALVGAGGAHAWVIGAALQQDSYTSYDHPRFDYRFMVPALFAQDELSVGSAVLLAASARLDQHSRYGTFLNPRLSILYRPTAWSIRASAGTGYFAPGPFNEVTEATGLRRLQPWDSLEAERAFSGSLDVGRTLGPLELNASAFASRVAHAVQTLVPAPGQLALASAAEPTRTWGGELFARYHQGGIHALATYAYTRATELSPEPADSGRRREVPLTPRHTAGLVGALEVEGHGRVAAELYYIGEQSLADDPFRERSESYVVTGLLGELWLGRARIFANFENLLNVRQTQFDPLVRPSRSREGLWTTDVWAPLEGRVVNAGVRLTL